MPDTKPLTGPQLERLSKMGDPFGAFGEELTYLPRAVNELIALRGLVRLIYGKANVGSVPLEESDLRDLLNDIAMQIRTTPGFGPGER